MHPFSRIDRQELAQGGTFIAATPAADIAHMVLRYQSFVAPPGMIMDDCMPADLFYPVILNLGSPWQIGNHADSPHARSGYDSFVAGLTDRPTGVASTDWPACLQMDLTPFGAHALFGCPLHELQGHVVDLNDMPGLGWRDLIDRLSALNDGVQQLGLLDRAVRSRLMGHITDPLVAAVWQQLDLHHGGLRISDLAARFDCSREHLSRRFRHTIGMSPKGVARIMRFRHASALVRQEPRDWAELAHDAGYADQAHFNNEFRGMSGMTPTEFLRSHSSNTAL